MSSSTQQSDTARQVLSVEGRTEPVAVKDTFSGAVSRAYVTDDGVLRSLDGDKTYDQSMYRVLPPELSQPVILNGRSHENSYHTTLCRGLQDVRTERRTVITVEEARNFYDGYTECSQCESSQDLGSDAIEAIASGAYDG